MIQQNTKNMQKVRCMIQQNTQNKQKVRCMIQHNAKYASGRNMLLGSKYANAHQQPESKIKALTK